MFASPASSVRVIVLGSGSSGNATAVTDGTTTVLVDCGFSAREVARRLTDAGLDADCVTAVLLTHEHSDHLRGVRVFSHRHNIPVYASPGTRRASGLNGIVSDARTIVPGEDTRVGTFSVMAFHTSHDAAEPIGLRIESSCGTRIGLCTDTGHLTEESAEALADVDVLGIESNHDPVMLERGPYPYFLKQRIASPRGHLANAAAADALERLASPRLRHVFALHLSRTNNTADLALSALSERAARMGLDVPIVAAHHERACGCGEVPSLFSLLAEDDSRG